MKMKKLLTLGLAGILAAGISSCSNDGVTDLGGATPLESDQSFFVNIEINGTDAMTRATVDDNDLLDYDAVDEEGDTGYDPMGEPDFDKGTADDFVDENKVSTIYLIFYDVEGKRVATTQVRKDNQNTSQAGRTESENSLYNGVVQIDVKHGSLKPAYVMAFVNPITATNFDINPDFETLENLEKVTRSRLIADDDASFAMSKSVYYGYDPVTKKEKQRIMATPIESTQLFTTKEEAEKALEENSKAPNNQPNIPSSPIIDIYVERYAAKVKFSIDSKAQKDIEVDQNALTFEPEYWAVNAYESETYVTKSFFTSIDFETGSVGSIISYDDMDKALKGDGKGWYWNSEQFHRCYWAQSPAYYSEKYPRVADDILDKQTPYNATGGYSLGYYSYNEMVKNADGSVIAKARKVGAEDNKAIYARENTTSGKALIAAYRDPLASPKAAIGSIVLVGHYKLNGVALGENDFFYVMGNSTNGYSLFKNYDDMLKYFVKTTIRFANWSDGTNTFFNYTTGEFYDQTYKDLFKIEHPNASVRGVTEDEDGLVIDSRFVTIQLNVEALTEDQDFYALIDGEYKKVDRTDAKLINKINQQMLYAAGTVQGFKGGKAYFTIPIKHLGFYRTDNKNKGKNANDKNFDWTAVQSGDFGLVRNHIYSIIVDNIKGLGNGIPDPTVPIVPPTDPEEYFIGARVIVLNWTVVPAQHVTL